MSTRGDSRRPTPAGRSAAGDRTAPTCAFQHAVQRRYVDQMAISSRLCRATTTR